MKLTIKRVFSRTRQIADFVPVRAECEASAEIDVPDYPLIPLNKIDDVVGLTEELSLFCESEVEKTLAGYTPSCIVCGGKALFPKKVLNKEGVCAQCQSENEMKLRDFKKERSTK